MTVSTPDLIVTYGATQMCIYFISLPYQATLLLSGKTGHVLHSLTAVSRSTRSSDLRGTMKLNQLSGWLITKWRIMTQIGWFCPRVGGQLAMFCSAFQWTKWALVMALLWLQHQSVSEWVSRVLWPAQHITGHFREESFHAITCTGTNNQTQNNQRKIHKKTQRA